MSEKDIVQYIIIRKDLNMRKGKMVAQGAHASMGVIFNYLHEVNDKTLKLINIPEDMMEWINGTFTKICVCVNSEEELISLHEQAIVNDFPCSLIKDKGLTEFHGIETKTAIAIGPIERTKVKHLVGDLKLL